MEVQHITRKKLVGLTNRVFRKKDKGDVPFADFIELKRCRRGSLDDLEIEYSANVSSNSSTLVRAGARAGARKNSFRSHKILSPAIHFDVQEPEEMEQNNVELRNEDLEEMNEEESSEVDFSDDLFFLPNTNNFITYIGNNANNNPYDIQTASIHKLIEVLTTPDQKLQNEYKEFVRLFFMTYRSFTSSETVIDLLIRRYKGPKNFNIINQRQKKKLNLNSIREGVCKCLVHWFTTHYHDFSGKPLAKKLQAFIDWVVTNDPPTENNFTGYLSDMYKTKVVKGTYSSLFGSGMLVFKDACPEPILPANWNDVTFLDLNEVEIARQLTVAEYHIYADIQPVELQELAWSSSKLKKLAPRILEMIDRLNKFSYSVSTLIVLTSKLKARKKVVEKFAKIAQGLLEMQNFQSLMAVHSAFQNSGIHRLHHTFNSLTKKSSEIIAHMKELFSPENSFKLYRETLKQCKSPCIPFIGVYLTDLTFIDEGNPQIVNGLVNFRKKQLEADVITQVLKFQKKNYQFQLVPQFAKLYQALPCLEESEVYQKSLEIEPRETKKKDIK